MHKAPNPDRLIPENILANRPTPDVDLLDLEQLGLDGVPAIPPLLQAAPETRILVFTAYDTDERLAGAIRAGAHGYLLKGASAAEIARSLGVTERTVKFPVSAILDKLDAGSRAQAVSVAIHHGLL